MKKSIAALMVALILAFAFTIPAASAGGLREKLGSFVEKIEERFNRDEEEPVTEEEEKHVLEKTVKGIIENLVIQTEETGIGEDDALNNLMQMITDETGEPDISALFGLLDMTGIGGDFEAADEDDDELASYTTALRNRDAVTEARIVEECGEMIGEGDVPFFSFYSLAGDEDDEKTHFGSFTLIVYSLDGADLKYKDSVSDIALFSYNMDEDLNFEITEVIVARDEETINALCERTGVERESFDRRTSKADLEFFTTFDLLMFMEDHPEYERVEYNGEMYTKDELDDFNTELCEAMVAAASGN